MMHIDVEALGASLERLRETPHETDVARALQQVVSSVDRLFGYDGAGIMLIDQKEQLLSIAASDEAGRSLEEAQAQAEEGPCYDTYVLGRPVHTKDVVRLDTAPRRSSTYGCGRWRSADPAGRQPGRPLNVYRSQPYGWDDSDMSALRAYADLVGELMAAALSSQEHSVTAAQLQYALDYRVAIERAIGYLMATHGVDAVAAFNRLRKQARDSRRRVAELAAEILGGDA